jgi:hypothetical protein
VSVQCGKHILLGSTARQLQIRTQAQGCMLQPYGCVVSSHANAYIAYSIGLRQFLAQLAVQQVVVSIARGSVQLCLPMCTSQACLERTTMN